MQKLVTVAINLEKLRGTAQGTFTITEVEEINNLLQDGWIIEEYEFLSSGTEDEQAVVLFILNDEVAGTEFDVTAEDEEDEDSLSEDHAQEEGADEDLEDEDKDDSGRIHANVPMI